MVHLPPQKKPAWLASIGKNDSVDFDGKRLGPLAAGKKNIFLLRSFTDGPTRVAQRGVVTGLAWPGTG